MTPSLELKSSLDNNAFYTALKAKRCYSIFYLHNNYCLFLGVKMLVEGNFGMNINQNSYGGNSPLKYAKDAGYNNIVSFLGSKGATPTLYYL